MATLARFRGASGSVATVSGAIVATGPTTQGIPSCERVHLLPQPSREAGLSRLPRRAHIVQWAPGIDPQQQHPTSGAWDVSARTSTGRQGRACRERTSRAAATRCERNAFIGGCKAHTRVAQVVPEYNHASPVIRHLGPAPKVTQRLDDCEDKAKIHPYRDLTISRNLICASPGVLSRTSNDPKEKRVSQTRTHPAGHRTSSRPTSADFTLGDWLVLPGVDRLRRGEETVKLRPQLMDLLICLASRPGETLTKEEIFDAVWPGQYVVESGLGRCIAEVRQVLGDTARNDSRYIETIPKRGYRLIAPVALVSPARLRAAADAAADPAQVPERPADLEAVSDGECPHVHADTSVQQTDVVTIPTTPVTLRPASTPRRWVLAVAALIAFVGVTSMGAWLLLRPAMRVDDHDSLVLVFENLTGEAVFDDTLQLAAAVRLEQSPHLRIVPEPRVREALGFMNRPANTVMTRELGRDVCQRVGAKAMLAGRVVSLGKHYAIGLEGVSCGTGDTLVREQVEVENREQVLGGLDRAVSSLRRRLGESVASLRRYDVPIAQATTASLEALKAFSLADVERARGNDETAVGLYRRALEIDPSFALAHLRLGLHLTNLNRIEEGVEEIKAAYSNRTRASAGERLYITACYESRVLRDPVKAAESLRAWRDSYPNNPVARFTLASMDNQLGRQQEAVVEAQEALRLDPGNSLAGTILGESLEQLGRLDEAARLADELALRHPASALLHGLQLDLAFMRGDHDRVRRQLEWASTSSSATSLFVPMVRGMALFDGRLDEARRLADPDRMLTEYAQSGGRASVAWLEYLSQSAMLGAARDVPSVVERGLRSGRTSELLVQAALALAWAGQPDAAERYLKEYESLPDVVSGSDRGPRLSAHALIALARNDPNTAIDILAPLRPFDAGWRFGFEPAYIRGLALLRLGRPGQAGDEFQRIVSRRGVVVYGAIYPLALVQLGRARAMAGDSNASRVAYERALQCWEHADPGVPVVVEADRELKGLLSRQKS